MKTNDSVIWVRTVIPKFETRKFLNFFLYRKIILDITDYSQDLKHIVGGVTQKISSCIGYSVFTQFFPVCYNVRKSINLNYFHCTLLCFFLDITKLIYHFCRFMEFSTLFSATLVNLFLWYNIWLWVKYCIFSSSYVV